MFGSIRISKDEVQKRRSPRELLEYVEEVGRIMIAADRSARESAMLKQGLYRQFLNEIRPLGWCAHLLYPETYTIEPVLGNQGFDANVYCDGTSDEACERVEMAFPHDGEELYQEALLKVVGRTCVNGGNPIDEFDALLPIILATCKRKARKDYSDCTVVIFVPAGQPVADFRYQYEEQIERTRKLVSGIKFTAKRVFLFLFPNRLIQIA